MQVEHLTQFYVNQKQRNLQRHPCWSVGQAAKNKQHETEKCKIQISARLALVALTACQLTPYGPIALVIHSTWSLQCVIAKTVFIFSQPNTRACTNICICFTQIYSNCWISFVDHRLEQRLEYCSRRAHVKKDANFERLRDLLFDSWFSGHFYPKVRQILTFYEKYIVILLDVFRHYNS